MSQEDLFCDTPSPTTTKDVIESTYPPAVCQTHPKFTKKWISFIDKPKMINSYKYNKYIDYSELFAELAHLQFHQNQELMTITKQMANIQKLLIELSQLEREHLKLLQEDKEEAEDEFDKFILSHDAKRILDEVIERERTKKTIKEFGDKEKDPGSQFFKPVDEYEKQLLCDMCSLSADFKSLKSNTYLCSICYHNIF